MLPKSRQLLSDGIFSSNFSALLANLLINIFILDLKVRTNYNLFTKHTL